MQMRGREYRGSVRVHAYTIGVQGVRHQGFNLRQGQFSYQSFEAGGTCQYIVLLCTQTCDHRCQTRDCRIQGSLCPFSPAAVCALCDAGYTSGWTYARNECSDDAARVVICVAICFLIVLVAITVSTWRYLPSASTDQGSVRHAGWRSAVSGVCWSFPLQAFKIVIVAWQRVTQARNAHHMHSHIAFWCSYDLLF